MDKKEVGKVTPEERDVIKSLYERKNGLLELSKSLAGMTKQELDTSPLYEKITGDLGRVTLEFQGWWDRMSKKYEWENIPGHKWEIDFETRSVFIRKQLRLANN